MHGKYFTYDGESSADHNLMIAGLEQNDEITFGMSREILKGSFNRYKSKVGHMGAQWQEPLEFSILFMKDVCNVEYNDSNILFTEDEVNTINAWLTSPEYPTLFHMYDYDFERDSQESFILVDVSNMEDTNVITIVAHGFKMQTIMFDELWNSSVALSGDGENPPELGVLAYDGYIKLYTNNKQYLQSVTTLSLNNVPFERINVRDWLSTYSNGDCYEDSYTILIDKDKYLNVKYDYFGVFSNVEPQVLDSMVVGFKATFTTNSPFAWTHEITQTMIGNELSFYVNSADRYGNIYPTITIKPNMSTDSTRQQITIHNQRDPIGITLNLYQGVTTLLDCEKCQIYLVYPSGEEDHSIYTSIDDVINNMEDSIADAIVKNGTLVITPDARSSSNADIFDMIDGVQRIHWPRLYNGENDFVIDGDCEISITYREPRKVGDY